MAKRHEKSNGGKLKDKQAGLLLEELAAGVADGVPLDALLRALADDLTDRRLQHVANQLAVKLEQGADLDEAVQSLANVLPTHFRKALAIGAQTGNLPGVLAGLSESEVARQRMRRGLRTALAYPVLVISFLLLVLLGLSQLVMPYFRAIFEDFELDLPYLTIYVLKLADWFPTLLLVIGVVVVVILATSIIFVGSRFWHWIRATLPVLGRAWTWSAQHELAALLATLTRQQVPIDQALECAIESLRDRNLAWAVRRVQNKCAAGYALGQAMGESIHFDPTLPALVQWGETQHSLPAALTEATDTFEKQMELYNRFLYRILPPLMFTVVVTAIGMTVAAMFIPLITLINGLTG